VSYLSASEVSFSVKGAMASVGSFRVFKKFAIYFVKLRKFQNTKIETIQLHTFILSPPLLVHAYDFHTIRLLNQSLRRRAFETMNR